MKKLLIPLIILLLIIGYFMSRGGHESTKDTYDMLETPKDGSMDDRMSPPDERTPPPDEGTPPPDERTPPPDGMGTPDSTEPQQSDQPDTMPPGSSLRNREGDAATGAGEAVSGAAQRAAEAVQGAAQQTGETADDAGEAAKKAAEEAAKKLSGEDTGGEEESQN